MNNNTSEKNSVVQEIPIYIFGFIVVGLFMGGIYSLPAMRLTNNTDPWFTILLGIGLSITVGTMVFLITASYLHVIYAILIANVLLIIRRYFGKLDHNAERFGMIHALCLIGCFWYAILITG